MEGIITTVINTLADHFLTVAVTSLIPTVILLWKKIMALNAGVKALLRNSIIIQCERSLENSEVTIRTRDSIEGMYSAYHGLGGNGSVLALVSKVRVLPHKCADE